MAKRKRQSRPQPETDPAEKAKRFTNKLAKSLFNDAHEPIQEGRIAEALAAAVASLPANKPMQQVLQQNLGLYTNLLLQQLTDLQQGEAQAEDLSTKKQKTAFPSTSGAQCLSALCHRECHTDKEKVGRCHQILAACVTLIPSGIVPQEPGLSVALDAIRDTLRELCAATIDTKGTADQARLLKPVVTQLTAIFMLNNKGSSSSSSSCLSGCSSMSQADLQHLGAEAALLAAEMRWMLADQSPSACRHERLAAHDIQTSTGGCCDAILDMLLKEDLPCASPTNSEIASALWRILYKATLQLKHADASDRDFLLRIAAAQKACTIMPANAAQIMAAFDSMPAPASFIAWLQRQPQSTIVQQCLSALQHSPLRLTQHLLTSHKAKTLLALHQSTDLATEGLADNHGEASQADEALFYVDEGGESNFGRGWDAGTADETADEDTATEGLNLDKRSKIQNPGFSDDDSSADE